MFILYRSNVSLVELYKSFLPVILLTCLTALLLNLAIMTAILSSAHLLKFRSSRGYLPTVTSLVCADTLTSLMLGIDQNKPKFVYFQIIIWSSAINRIESWPDIKFSNSYIDGIIHRLYNPLNFKTRIICSNKIHKLYQRSTKLGCKDIGIRKSEFVAKTQLPFFHFWLNLL